MSELDRDSIISRMRYLARVPEPEVRASKAALKGGINLIEQQAAEIESWELACKNESTNASRHQRVSVNQGEKIAALESKCAEYDQVLEKLKWGFNQVNFKTLTESQEFAATERQRIAEQG